MERSNRYNRSGGYKENVVKAMEEQDLIFRKERKDETADL